MGYCSEIAIEMFRKDYDRMVAGIEEHPAEYNILNDATVYERDDADEPTVTIYWRAIKWYDDVCCSFIDCFLESVPYHKSVIGENLTDAAEVMHDWPYDIDGVCIHREIVGWDIGKQIN